MRDNFSLTVSIIETKLMVVIKNNQFKCLGSVAHSGRIDVDFDKRIA